jgi:signal recognition particle receptor subunit beta
MDYASADQRIVPLKVLVAGGFGVGKTTFVGVVSEIAPVTTEQALTERSVGIDDTSQVTAKTTTTVAMDFGRLTVDDQLILYLFGTPGQHRFWFMWDDLARGAVGAVVLVDLRRAGECFAAIDFFEDRRIPFVVAVNRFPDAEAVPAPMVREALSLGSWVPVVELDARSVQGCTDALIALAEHALARSTAA